MSVLTWIRFYDLRFTTKYSLLMVKIMVFLFTQPSSLVVVKGVFTEMLMKYYKLAWFYFYWYYYICFVVTFVCFLAISKYPPISSSSHLLAWNCFSPDYIFLKSVSSWLDFESSSDKLWLILKAFVGGDFSSRFATL